MTEHDQSRDRPGDQLVRITVAEAADQLGISEAGVRKRVQRNQIPHERDDTGRVFVWISPGETRHAESRDQPGQSRDASRSEAPSEAPLVEELRDRIRYLERQVEEERSARFRADQLLARLMERIPELEPPSDERESPETAADEQQRRGPIPDAGAPQEPAQPRSWWRRMFGP